MSLEALRSHLVIDAVPGPSGRHRKHPGSVQDQDRAAKRRAWELMTRLPDATPAERLLIRDEVVGSHLWLADRAAWRYGPRGEHDDLVQVARIGLVEAFDRYDPTQGSYRNFAWTTMTGLLRHHLRDHGWSVRPPRTTQEAANTLRGTAPGLAQLLGRAPSTADLATYLGWPPDLVREARRAELGLRAASLDATRADVWMLEHPSEGNVVETRVLLDRVSQNLSQAERDLIRMRFFEEMSQSQIAALVGVTQMQVSRLLARLMTKLREQIGELDEYPQAAGPTGRAQARRTRSGRTVERGRRSLPERLLVCDGDVAPVQEPDANGEGSHGGSP